jgi:hypothetical protein
MATPNTRFRTKGDAFAAVTRLIAADIERLDLGVQFDSTNPDGDAGKFTINGKIARAIHVFNGYHLPIRLEWFSGGTDKPVINRTEFDYYVFAIEPRKDVPNPHYFIADYLSVRQWVLEFDAPLGNNWETQSHWMANIRTFSDGTGYFRWGDEPTNDYLNPSRLLALDNVGSIESSQPTVGSTASDDTITGTGGGNPIGGSGESDRHKRLKEYVAQHPEIIGLGSSAKANVEYRFTSGDRADVVLTGGGAAFTAVEVELEGAKNLVVGAYQAIKYAILCCAEAGLDLDFGSGKPVRAVLVAHETDYPEVSEIAFKYGVELVSVPESSLQP